MRVALIETALLAGLLLLAAYVLWDSGSVLSLPVTGLIPGLLSLETLSLVVLLLGVYWGLQLLGRNQLSFWMMTAVVIVPHVAAVWGHNQLEWYQLLGLESGEFGEGSILRDAARFLACIGILLALHRTTGLRILEQRLTHQGIGSADRQRLLQYQGLLVAGLLVLGLGLALLTVVGAELLSGYGLLSYSNWSIGIVGTGAASLLALSLLLWRNSRPV